MEQGATIVDSKFSTQPVIPTMSKDGPVEQTGELKTDTKTFGFSFGTPAIFVKGKQQALELKDKIVKFVEVNAAAIFFVLGSVITLRYAPITFVVSGVVGAYLQKNYARIINKFDQKEREVTILQGALAFAGAISAIFNHLNPDMSYATKLTPAMGGLAFGMFLYTMNGKYGHHLPDFKQYMQKSNVTEKAVETT